MNLMRRMIPILILMLPISGWGADLRYSLHVRVETGEQRIYGEARLSADTRTTIDLSVSHLENLVVDGDFRSADREGKISVTVKGGRETVLRYEAGFPEGGVNLVDEENVFLVSRWYPVPDRLAEYMLSVALPQGFLAVSEADRITVTEEENTKTFRFQFNHPIDALHLAASKDYAVTREQYNDILIEAYFFKEDASLARTYIEHTKKYLALYEELLTPYPYKRFAIVENRYPTGYSMPTFTLLGRQVVKLPFIVKTSLGHEILHEWFGNSVYIDMAHGNWAEGITAYLADHLYADRKNEGSVYRKKILVDYAAYVNGDNATTVSDFHSRQNKAQGAIGYGKTAMLFHGLRKRYGDEMFFSALKGFIDRNLFREASWHDIQRAFEKETGDRLYSFFDSWLTRSDIPQLHVENSRVEVEQGQLLLKFDLLQKGEPYELQVPVTLHSQAGRIEQVLNIGNARESIVLPVDEVPTEVVIDGAYALMRTLHQDEIPPVLAAVMGSQKLLVVTAGKERPRYQPIIDSLGVDDTIYIEPEKVTPAMANENTLVIAGVDNAFAEALLGKQAVPESDVFLKVFKNPYNPDERVLLLHVSNRKEAKAIVGKIPHYGKYSELAFVKGRNIRKVIDESKNGITVLSRPAAIAVKPEDQATLEDILPELKKSRVIYVGERHDRYEHHINQLRVIKRLHEAGISIGVGMEMFQAPFQQVIDDYLVDRIDEGEFLKKTGYFERWRYDYNLYKPIIDYLKKNRIPLVALNIEGGISRKVARQGIDSLIRKEKKQIPASLDFSNEQYRRDLREVFALHGKETSLTDFNFFLQAQVLWDEGMAEAAYRFLENHPDRNLVVIAGNGHIRHHYGIPDRLFRRSGDLYSVVVQDEEIEPGIADYILLTTRIRGKKSPRLGVEIGEEEGGLLVAGVVDKSPAKKAGGKKGDILVRFKGKPITSLSDLKIGLFYTSFGDKVSMGAIRDGKEVDLEIELFEQTSFSPHFKKKK